ncbi:MAG: tRNA-dihydrouridine synthase [Proteobacteria bacterium]|uniref:tRNA dihydrouridine synthase n=1 Tax=Aquabacterium sp. TaxID=1872578 RepID=UPI0035C7055B|nr:tRNA-dihydrouridine synthase [Pseudomonadota bacterium]
MEGLLDAPLRDVLTRTGGIDRCVSEFIRVTGTLLPERAFRRVMPELDHGGRTWAGVPVRGQLLGSDPACLADNAARLAEMGSPGVDLNFGCPARVVNRHGGGAALLQEPELLERIVAAVRRAVPAHVPVTAKMRLGFHDDLDAEVCAQAIEAGGASELVVHGRTKAHGYRPPAYWERIADVRQAVRIPVVANGEVWTVADARQCIADSGCDALMLGRGMVADPGLALAVRAELGWLPGGLPTPGSPSGADWATLQPLLHVYWALVAPRVVPRHRPGRLKQWLNFLRRRHPQAELAYQAVRTLDDPRHIERWLHEHVPLPAESDMPEAPTPAVCGDNADLAEPTR